MSEQFGERCRRWKGTHAVDALPAEGPGAKDRTDLGLNSLR